MSENQSEKKQEIMEGNDQQQEIDVSEENSQEQVEQVKQVLAEVIKSEFSGPIPPPNIIKGYEDILPGAADRIITMAEEQSRHRQHMEKEMIRVESRDSSLGIMCAFGLGIGCIIAAIVMSVMVPDSAGVISGSILGVTGIGSIIATFVKSTRNNYGKDAGQEEN